MTHALPYSWRLSDGYPAAGIKSNGRTVFGTFICGGGSTMGYKLAGFHHLGGVEIDPKVAEIYRRNHKPEFLYVEDLRIFNERTDLPDQLYQLDVLDGSPPCTTFSMAGRREETWNKEKKFAEGQARQTLDDLVFVYCDTIAKLHPKTFILENVKGLALGNAKSYLRRIVERLKTSTYICQVFVLNAASMGVPQMRERCFIIGRKEDLNLPNLKLSFSEPVIPFGEVIDRSDRGGQLTPQESALYKAWCPKDGSLSDTNRRVFGKNSGFSRFWASEDRPCHTLTTLPQILSSIPRKMNEKEILRVSTFPEDYDYTNYNRLVFLTGMSVPPVMTAQIAHQMDEQWFQR